MAEATTEEQLVTMANRLTLAEAGRVAAKSPSAIFRWIRDGVRGVHLAHIRLGRSIYTSEPAMEAFGRAVADAAFPSVDDTAQVQKESAAEGL